MAAWTVGRTEQEEREMLHARLLAEGGIFDGALNGAIAGAVMGGLVGLVLVVIRAFQKKKGPKEGEPTPREPQH
jgi:hypothetical protein